MKKQRKMIVGGLGVLAIAVIIFIGTSSAVNVVRDTDPMQSSAYQDTIVSKLQAAKTLSEKQAIMKKYAGYLTPALIAYVRQNGYSCNIDSVTYSYGSGKADSVTTSDKEGYVSGKYTDEPYATICGEDCFKNGLNVFIACFNKTFTMRPRSSYSLGVGNTIVTIEQGKGLNWYLNYKNSIWVAEKFHLPISVRGKIISPDSARALESTLGENLVNVKIYQGDKLNLGTMEYIPNKP